MSDAPFNALPNRIASEIRALISTGEIGSHAHLSTQKLADRFEVSRSPVREALQILAEQGVVEQKPNRGYFTLETPAIIVPTQEVSSSDAPAAYYRLAEDWIRDLVPADVTEQSLRDRYELTKGQLTQLLNRALNEGWIERKAGYGWRLLPVAKTPEALEQIYRFRAVIEPAALLEPTFEYDKAAGARIRRTQELMLDGCIETWPADHLHRAGVEFHEELARMSGNPIFHQALIRANRLRRLLEYRSMLDRSRVYKQSREHVEILDLLEQGRMSAAHELLKRHLGQAMEGKRAIQQRLAK